MPGLRLAPDGDVLRLGTDAGRLEAVLVRRPRSSSGPPRLLGASWGDGEGRTRVAWPGPDGEMIAWTSGLPARRAVFLPAALGIVAALRRAGPDLGGRSLVIGDGLASALARAVAADFGARETKAAEDQARAALVLVADASGEHLDEGLRRAEDGGVCVALGDPRELPPLDYYPQVHRRGLSFHIAPPLPDPAEAGRLLERGRARLERLLAGLEAGAPSGAEALTPDGSGFFVGPCDPGWSIHTPPA